MRNTNQYVVETTGRTVQTAWDTARLWHSTPAIPLIFKVQTVW